MDYPWIIHGLSMKYPWNIHEISTDYPQIIHGLFGESTLAAAIFEQKIPYKAYSITSSQILIPHSQN